MIQQHPGLYFAPSKKHRYGMFCTEDIQAESLIEICPIILLPKAESNMILKGHMLYDYYFEWSRGRFAIALGYGSLYNHAGIPNAYFELDLSDQLILFKAVMDIPAGTEITVDYHAGNPDQQVWFDINH